ncbi:ATP-binding protein [Streptomyces sp. NPDC013178]|uniref:ATP-binding protein n=1 Tax=Streptomyces sp. NPDC013178 TaxID=3155118 RepID=UPI0033DA1CD6
MLLVSELAANAVRHVSGPRIRVHVDRPAPPLLLFAVVDNAPDRRPHLRTPGPDDVSGRGLLLLAEFADRWGHDTVCGPASQPGPNASGQNCGSRREASHRPGHLTTLQGPARRNRRAGAQSRRWPARAAQRG